jgi:hypothetical protein
MIGHRAAASWSLLMLFVIAAGAEAGEQMTVRLQSGRTFTAQIDARTDNRRLWLRFENGAMTLWRPVRWDRVVEGTYQGQTLTPAKVRAAAERIKSEPSRVEEVAPAIEAQVSHNPHSRGAMSPRTRHSQVARLRLSDGQTRSLKIAARVANWDADVEADGLLLNVAAFDGRGREVPVEGHLTIELIGSRPAARLDQFVRVHGEPFPTLGRWTRQIDTRRAASGGACFQLPFQNAHPDFDAALGAYGVVHARLVAPGQGVFEASADRVRLRAYSPLREQLQQSEGTRFFVREGVARRE